MTVSDFMAVVLRCWDFLKIPITLPGGFSVTLWDIGIFVVLASILGHFIGSLLSNW